MKTKEFTFNNADLFAGYDLTLLDMPVREQKHRTDMNIFDRTERDNSSSIKRIMMESNFKGMEVNKYHKPIPLNKIGLLSENFKRIKNFQTV